MPKWQNKPLVLFHGTDTHTMRAHAPFSHRGALSGFAVKLTLCRPGTDFGRGFYTTTSEHQARKWANARVRGLQSRRPPVSTEAMVLTFVVSRDWLAALESLSFILASNDFYDLVDDCRAGFRPHQRTLGRAHQAYDVVYGPVRMGPQRLIIHDCDQVSFHTYKAVQKLPTPSVADIASDPSGLFV